MAINLRTLTMNTRKPAPHMQNPREIKMSKTHHNNPKNNLSTSSNTYMFASDLALVIPVSHFQPSLLSLSTKLWKK